MASQATIINKHYSKNKREKKILKSLPYFGIETLSVGKKN